MVEKEEICTVLLGKISFLEMGEEQNYLIFVKFSPLPRLLDRKTKRGTPYVLYLKRARCARAGMMKARRVQVEAPTNAISSPKFGTYRVKQSDRNS